MVRLLSMLDTVLSRLAAADGFTGA